MALDSERVKSPFPWSTMVGMRLKWFNVSELLGEGSSASL
jgi:hypothetical protein